MSRIIDQALIGGALRGSPDAAAELFRRYWRSSWRVALAVVGRRAAADDVAQEAFVKAIGALAGFDAQRPFGPWLHRIVVNCAIDLVRSERRLVGLDQLDNETHDPFEDRLPDRELLAAVGRLDAGRRMVIALRYWLDYSPSEIADLLDLPVGTVSSRLSRALAELRKGLEASRV
jgi:RNA polymerase sigma-70 factor (ECF subfamily)